MPTYIIAACSAIFVFLSIFGYMAFARYIALRRVEAAFWDQVFPERPALYDWAVDPDGDLAVPPGYDHHPVEPARYYSDLPRNVWPQLPKYER